MVYYLSICTSTSVVLDLEYTSESQGGFVKRLLGPLPDFLIHETWGGAPNLHFLQVPGWCLCFWSWYHSWGATALVHVF